MNSVEMPWWMFGGVVLLLAIIGPIAIQFLWRFLHPKSEVPFARYTPHFAILFFIGSGWVRRKSAPSLADWAESYVVALTIWLVALTLLTLLRAHPSRPMRG